MIIAFLTTSAATVIGLFLVFLRWLSPQEPVRESGAVLTESRESRTL